eukprot:gene12792-biopygen303
MTRSQIQIVGGIKLRLKLLKRSTTWTFGIAPWGDSEGLPGSTKRRDNMSLRRESAYSGGVHRVMHLRFRAGLTYLFGTEHVGLGRCGSINVGAKTGAGQRVVSSLEQNLRSSGLGGGDGGQGERGHGALDGSLGVEGDVAGIESAGLGGEDGGDSEAARALDVNIVGAGGGADHDGALVVDSGSAGGTGKLQAVGDGDGGTGVDGEGADGLLEGDQGGT